MPAKQSNTSLQQPVNPAARRTSNIPIPRPRNPAGSNPKPILTNRPVNPATHETVSHPRASTTYQPLLPKSSDTSPWSPPTKSPRDTSTLQPNNKMNPMTARSISKAAASKRIDANKPPEDRLVRVFLRMYLRIWKDISKNLRIYLGIYLRIYE